MRIRFGLLMVALLVAPLLSACSALRSGSAVPAGYAAEKESSVTSRIPGVSSIANFLPAPTEARTKWDRYYEKRSDLWKNRDERAFGEGL